MFTDFKPLQLNLGAIPATRRFGCVISVDTAAIRVQGLSVHGHVGDQVEVSLNGDITILGEIISLEKTSVLVMPYGPSDGIAIGNLVELNLQITSARQTPGLEELLMHLVIRWMVARFLAEIEQCLCDVPRPRLPIADSLALA